MKQQLMLPLALPFQSPESVITNFVIAVSALVTQGSISAQRFMLETIFGAIYRLPRVSRLMVLYAALLAGIAHGSRLE